MAEEEVRTWWLPTYVIFKSNHLFGESAVLIGWGKWNIFMAKIAIFIPVVSKFLSLANP